MHQKEENLTENHTTPMVSEIYIQNSQSMKKTQVCSWIAFCRKTKANVETSGLTNLKVICRNLNEIVLPWIPSPYVWTSVYGRVSSQLAIYSPPPFQVRGVIQQTEAAKIFKKYPPPPLHDNHSRGGDNRRKYTCTYEPMSYKTIGIIGTLRTDCKHGTGTVLREKCDMHFMQLRALLPTHRNESPIYVFFFWKLRGLSPNFHIQVSVSELYCIFPRSIHTCSRIGRSNVGIYMNVKICGRAIPFLGIFVSNFRYCLWTPPCSIHTLNKHNTVKKNWQNLGPV